MDNREDLILLTPGPVHIDPDRFAGLEPMHHRTGAFREIVMDCGRMLGGLCGSSETAFLFAASGTGAMEAVIANIAHPGARVLVVEGGKFGRRWAEISRAFECEADILSFPMGEAADPEKIGDAVRRISPDVLALTHVESSTGLRLDVEAVVSALPDPKPLVALDAIASVGSEEISMDRWGIDVLAGAGQKGLAAPAGVSFVVARQDAIKAARKNSRPGYYFSFERYGEGMKTGDTPFTPAVYSVQLLHGSLERIGSVGTGKVLERHASASRALIAAAAEAAFISFPETASNSVQAFLPPDGVSCDAVIGELLENRRVMIAGGQDEMAGKIVRTGFPGIYGGKALERLVTGLAESSGVPVERALAHLDGVRGYEPLYGSLLT